MSVREAETTARTPVAAPSRGVRLGGVAGNEILTSAVAVVLTVLLLAEGVTILWIGPLRDEHMFIGLALIPPVGLKLASTGYRFARYYLGARAYREKGAPLLPLRMLAPLLVASTVGVLATGVALLLLGHRSGLVLEAHKVSFIVWGVCFGAHFLAHLPRVVRALGGQWSAPRRQRVAGSAVRGALVAASLGGGLALALALLTLIVQWHGG